MGNALHVDIGADFRGGEHNEVMYADGCPWRPDPANCSHATRPDAVKHGLQYLMGSFRTPPPRATLHRNPAPAPACTSDQRAPASAAWRGAEGARAR